MFTFEINVICDQDGCKEMEAKEPVKAEAIWSLTGKAIVFAQSKGWQVEVVNGHIRTLCPDCAKNEKVCAAVRARSPS